MIDAGEQDVEEADTRNGQATNRWSDLLTRSVSAFFLAVLVVSLTVYGDWPFAVMIALGAVVIHAEIIKMTGNRLTAPLSILFLFGILASIASAFTMVGAGWIIPLVALGSVALISLGTSGQGMRWIGFAGFYGLLFALPLIWLRQDGDDGVEAGLTALVFLFAVVWGTDISAYFAGRLLGGVKLCPSISPGKTWSGAIGGVIGGVLIGTGLTISLIETTAVLLGLVAVALSIVSQVGDLGESALKRRFDIKDSGRILPGHGGLMDRVDGLVTAGALALMIGWLRWADNPAAGLLIW